MLVLSVANNEAQFGLLSANVWSRVWLFGAGVVYLPWICWVVRAYLHTRLAEASSREKGVVPIAESLLCSLETRGRAGSSFGGFGADLREVAGSFGELSNGVKVIVFVMVQSAKSEGKDCRHVLESVAADCRIDAGSTAICTRSSSRSTLRRSFFGRRTVSRNFSGEARSFSSRRYRHCAGIL